MKPTVKKLLFALTLLFLLTGAALAGAAFYLYERPALVASWAEGQLSAATGLSVSIEALGYCLDPLRVQAGVLVARQESKNGGFVLRFENLSARMHLEGPLGSRRLVVDTVGAGDFRLEADRPALPDFPQAAKKDSRLFRMLRPAVSFFLFDEVRLEAVQLSTGSVDIRTAGGRLQARGIRASRRADGRVAISAAAVLKVPDRGFFFSAPQLEVTAPQVFSTSEGVFPAALSVKAATLAVAGAEIDGLSADAQIRFFPGRRVLEVSRFTAAASNFFRAAGSLEAAFDGHPRFSLALSPSPVQAETLLSLLRRTLQSPLPPVSIRGDFTLTGSVHGQRDGQGWSGSMNLEAATERADLQYRSPKMAAEGRVSATVKVNGGLPGGKLLVSGRARVQHAAISSETGRIDLSAVSVEGAGDLSRFDIETLSGRVPKAVFDGGPNDLTLRDLSFEGAAGTVDFTRPAAALSGIRIDAPGIGRLNSSVRVGPETWEVNLVGKDAGVAEAIKKLAGLASGWQLAAEESVRASLRASGKDHVEFQLTLGLAGLRFQDPGARYIGENIDAEIRAEGALNLGSFSAESTVNVAAKKGELLLDLFYFDLAGTPFFADAAGTYLGRMKTAAFESLKAGLAGLFTLHASGDVSAAAPRVDLSVRLLKSSLAPLYRTFVKEPFGRQLPVLAGLDAGGAISAEAAVSGWKPSWVVTGRLRWQDGSLTTEDRRFSLSGIDLDLPLWYRIGGSASAAEDRPLSGTVSVEKFEVPMLPVQGLQLETLVRPNRLTVPGPVAVRIPGGTLEIGTMEAGPFFQDGLQVETSLQVDSLDLAPLLGRYWPRPVSGAATGALNPVRLSGGRIETRGRITAQVFGGRVVVSDPGAERIFSSTPLFTLSAAIDSLDLGRLTQDTDFGKIQGTLEGYVKDLAVANGQPQRFELKLETAGSGSKEISIQAVENIARIGGGRSPFMGLAGLWTSFFETLSYSKIGVRASLRNDMFRINGTIQEEGTEYLMKRGAFTGVDIVNRNPDNRIRFADMVNRIRRVSQSKGQGKAEDR